MLAAVPPSRRVLSVPQLGDLQGRQQPEAAAAPIRQAAIIAVHNASKWGTNRSARATAARMTVQPYR
jgi:hypothetical protein